MSAFGICSVSAPRRLPRPAASHTACMLQSYLLKQLGQSGEAPNHRDVREAEHEALRREGRRHTHERDPFALGDLAVVKRIPDEQHLLSIDLEAARHGLEVRAPLGEAASEPQSQIE